MARDRYISVRYRVIPTPLFTRHAKDLFKRFPSLKDELKKFFTVLEKNGPQGDRLRRIPSLWKARLGLKSHALGKSSGFRIITSHSGGEHIYPVLIYFKGDMDNPSDDLLMRAILSVDSFSS